MKRYMTVAALAVAGLSVSGANAAITVLGKSEARTCYESARAHLTGESALDACNKAIRDQATSAQDRLASFVNRGIVKMASADLAGAVADFDTAIALDPNEPEAFLNKGIALLNQNADSKAARAMLDAAIAKRTAKPELAYYMRGIANERIGDVRGAYEAYRQAVLLAPTWDEPRRELARFRIVRQS